MSVQFSNCPFAADTFNVNKLSVRVVIIVSEEKQEATDQRPTRCKTFLATMIFRLVAQMSYP